MRFDAPILRTDRLAIYRMHAALPHCNATLLAAVELHAELSLMPCGYAMLVSTGPRMLIHHIEVISIARRMGLGLALLEAITQIYRATEATWATRNGQSLASAYQRKHGAVDTWTYLIPPMPDPSEALDDAAKADMLAEVLGLVTPHATTWRQLEQERQRQAQLEDITEPAQIEDITEPVPLTTLGAGGSLALLSAMVEALKANVTGSGVPLEELQQLVTEARRRDLARERGQA